MNRTKEQNYEKELPLNYKQVFYINAKDAKFGIIFNLIALLICAIVLTFAILFLRLKSDFSFEKITADPLQLFLPLLVLFVAMIAYVATHELTHGVAYKLLTGEKLTFGLSWSCAFCGVPHVYTYRKTALIAVISPFALFTLIFIPLLIVLYNISPIYYLVTAFLFGYHLGGCSGDLYVFILLATKFKNKKTLMKDTGPEQYFYIPTK